jgi:hypothetical protein
MEVMQPNSTPFFLVCGIRAIELFHWDAPTWIERGPKMAIIIVKVGEDG